MGKIKFRKQILILFAILGLFLMYEVEAWVELAPQLWVGPTSHDFGTSETSWQFTVANVGQGTLNWSASESLDWLSLSKTSGSLLGNGNDYVTATVSRTGKSPGTYNGTISITSNGGNQNVSVSMTVPEPPPALSVSPASHDFGENETNYQFTVANNGGGTLSWSASESLDWLSLSKSSGSVSGGSSENITVTVTRTGKSPGTYNGTISFTSNGGSQDVSVSMTVPQPAPLLSVSPTSLDFGTSGVNLTITVRNTGGGTLSWNASENLGWLSLNKISGNLGAGISENVTATVSRTGLTPGPYGGTISFTSNGGSQDVSVSMTVPQPDPLLSVNPTSLDFGTSGVNLTITVRNTGGGTLSWNASENLGWLSLSKSSGNLGAGISENVTATVSRTGLTPGPYGGTISFTSNGGNQDVSVSMTVPQPEPNPALSVSPTSLDFGTSGVNLTIIVRNTGGGTLSWNASENLGWLSLNKISGNLGAGISENVTAMVSRTGLTPGPYGGTISFTSNGGSQDVSVSMTVADTTPPTGTISINNGAQYTNSTAVTLNLSANDDYSGVNKMRFSNDGTNWTTEEQYNTIKSWTLSTGSDGTRRVYVQYRDGANNWSNSISDTIILDTTPPEAPVNVDDGVDGWSGNNTPTFTWESPGDISGIAGYWWAIDDETPETGGTWTTGTKATTDKLSDGEHTFYVKAQNGCGLVGPAGSHICQIDATVPSGTILINGGAERTNSTSVTLSLWASTGVVKMRFRNEGGDWTSEQDFAETKSWTLLGGDGVKRVYVQYKNNAGNLSAVISDTIILDTQEPMVELVVEKARILPDGEVIGVIPDTGMEARFSELMRITAVEKGLELIAEKDNLNRAINEKVPLEFDWVSSSETVKMNPESGELKKNYLYKLQVTDKVKDLARNTVTGERELIFRTIMDHTKKNIVAKTEVEGSTKTVTVTLEANALQEDGYLIINTKPLTYPLEVNPGAINVANEKSLTDGWYPVEGCLWEIKACKENGDWIEDNFGSEVKITLPYDEDKGEETFMAFWLNEEHSNWVRVPGSGVDKESNVVVTGEVPNFSVFALMGTALYDLREAHAYPVPWKPNDGKDETGTEEQGITFTNLAAECVIKIYTISGELVMKHEYKGGGNWTWDVKTSNKEKVFSGVYIYYIEGEKEHKTGKLVIIR
jgi:hypothetical protein